MIQPRLPIDLTDYQKRSSLSYLMFLKYKIDGSIKGKGCADVSPQQLFMQNEDTTSPTISIQCLVFSCMIDTKEDMGVATADILGPFLHTDDTSGSTSLNLDGMMAGLLACIYPDIYRK